MHSGTAHRAHASTVGVPQLVTEKAAGLLMKEELENLDKAFSNPTTPVVAIFGGAKVSDKLEVLRHILQRMDCVLIGGGMANTFLRAQGFGTGASSVEEDMIGTASEIMESARKRECAFVLPSDVVVAKKMEAGVDAAVVATSSIPDAEMALDIGPETVDRFTGEIRKAGTIVWNGPMGVFEIEGFERGTMKTAQAVASASGFSVVGGGDTIRAIRQAGVAEKISYVSTGGGAFMEYMEGKTLPGVAALETS